MSFKVGTKLVLNCDKLKINLNIPKGTKCEVVDPQKEFPLTNFTVCCDIKGTFIAIKWDRNSLGKFGVKDYPIDGYFEDTFFDEYVEEVKCNEKIPVTNEGRETCFKCGKSTIKVPGFTSSYTICPECKV